MNYSYDRHVQADVPRDWKSEFPHHSGVEGLQKVYDDFYAYARQLDRARDPAMRTHRAALDATLDAILSALHQAKKTEATLYAGL